jgi:hypothetical protein
MRPNQIHAVLCAGHNTTLVCSQGRHSVWPSSNHVRNRGKPHACHTDTDAMVAGSEMRLQGRAVALHSMATRTFKAHTQATTVLLVRKPAHVCTHTHTHTHTHTCTHTTRLRMHEPSSSFSPLLSRAFCQAKPSPFAP